MYEYAIVLCSCFRIGTEDGNEQQKHVFVLEIVDPKELDDPI